MTANSPYNKPNQLPGDALVTVSDAETDADRLREVRERFSIHASFWSRIHDVALEDDRYIAGIQWPDKIRRDREDDGRPVLTYNLLPSFCRQITNRVRQDRPQIKVTPVETTKRTTPKLANISGTKDYALADVYSGLIRNIEHVSRADQAYDTAVKHAVDHGFGWFMLMNVWSKDDPFVQDLRIIRIKNSYTVYMDPDAQEADFRDAQDAFIFETMKRKTFEKKYPDVQPTQFDGTTIGTTYTGWWDGENIRLAQYFWIEHQDDEVLMLSNGSTVYESRVGPVLDELKEQTGIHVIKDDAGKEMRKKVKRPVCMWQKMTAADVIEGPLELPFSAIPIFPVLGEEVLVDGDVTYESAIRHAKDPQRSYNYWRTAAAEAVALAPRAPFMLTAKQVAGHEELYESANTRNLPYMLYNHQDGVAPPQRQFPANPAAAEMQNAIQDGVDMQTIIGLHDASLGRESNEKSGKAIIARQNQGSTSTFQFPDNLGRALEQMGRLIVEAIPQLYDTQRVLRVRFPDGSEDFVEINQTAIDRTTGESFLLADIAFGKYDVTLETGPSYATQRQEAADLQLELLKVLGPDKASNIVHLIVKNLGVPGSDEVAAVLRKMLPDQLKSEEEKEADLPKDVTKDAKTGQLMKDGQPWEPPMTPEMQLMAKQQQIDEGKIKAEMATAEAKVATAEADKAQAAAKMAELQAGPAGPTPEQQAAQGKEMMGQIETVITNAMKDHEGNPQAHKDATQEMIADAVVDALKRVKGFVDRKMGPLEKATEKAMAGEAAENRAGTSSSPGPNTRAPAAAPATNINLNLEPKPERIRFEYDAEGNITAGIPVYEDEGQETEGTEA